MLNKLFSITKSGSRTVINVCGIKLKFFSSKSAIYAKAPIINANFFQLLYVILPNAADDDLFCLKSDIVTFIFHKKCLQLDYDFLQSYLLPSGFSNSIFHLIMPDKTSVLYKEHINRLQNNEFCWKYIDRYYFIAHSFISQNKNGEIYIHSSYVPEKNLVQSKYKIRHIPMNSSRKYIRGIALGDYINQKNLQEQECIVDKLLNYIFTTYRDENHPEKVSGRLLDCHLYNFILGEDGMFHFIDFDMMCTEPLERSYCVYFMLYRKYNDLYRKMIKRYNLPDKANYYMKNFSINQQPLSQDGKSIITEEHKALQQKYFSDEGIKPNYSVLYEKTKL